MNRKLRRAAQSIRRRGTMSPEARLSTAAFEIITEDLTAFGSRLSVQHQEALMRIVGMFSYMAYGLKKGRYAFPLSTGCGKTQSVVAWCTAVHKLSTGHSVVVAASKVEDLADIHRKLVAKGIPESAIGIIHSKRFEPTKAAEWLRTRDPQSLTDDKGRASFASLPATTDNDGRQLMLVTHARVQSRKAGTIELLNTYQGKPRDVCVWDESMIVSQSRGVSKMEVDSAIGWFGPRARDAAQHATVAYINECREILAAELTAQRKDGQPPRTIRLPARDDLELDRMTKALGSGPVTKPLRDFLGLSQGDLRVVTVNQGGGAFVTYDIVVPEELRTVAILDASYAIRELEKMDSTIKRDPGFNGDVKQYDTVTVHHLKAGSGRSTIERSFSQRAREDRDVSAEICDVVKTIPDDQGIILFTFKQGDSYRSPDIVDILKDDLKKAGVDVNAQVVDGDGRTRPRLRWLTWGMETSISDHKDCPNVIFAGVLHRSEADLSGAIIGQQDNILADVPGTLVSDIQRSEIAHSLYQALSRGACRDTIDGHAKPMNAWLIHHDSGIPDMLSKVMPGLRWQTWEPNHIDPIEAKAEDLLLTIAGYLRGVSPETTRLSTRAVKRDLWGEDTDNGPAHTTFTRAVQSIAESDIGWSLDGRSLVRTVHGLTAATS